MTLLLNGLNAAKQDEAALSVGGAQLSTLRRLGACEDDMLVAQGNLAVSYQNLGRNEEALHLRRDVYSERLKLNGEEYEGTLRAAYNYAVILVQLERDQEAKSLMHRTLPVARRALGDNDRLTLKIRGCYVEALYKNSAATLDDVREAVNTLEEMERTARRVFGSAHPLVATIEAALREARAALRARETPSEAV